MYCGTITTWNGSMMVPSIKANNNGFRWNSSRANAYAAMEHEQRLPTTDNPEMMAELRKNCENGIPSPIQPCAQLSRVICRGHRPGSEKISRPGLNALE